VHPCRKCPCVHASMGAPMPKSTKVCAQILVSLGVFGLLGPKRGSKLAQTFVHKGLYENRLCLERSFRSNATIQQLYCCWLPSSNNEEGFK